MVQSTSLLARINAEIGHWVRRSWSTSDIAAHWDATEDYDAINKETYSYHRRFVDGMRLSDFPSDARILDFCARTGNGTAYFHHYGKVRSAVCADVSFKMGEICIQRLKEVGLDDFIWVPITDRQFPFSPDTFDGVLCFETVEHFPDPDWILKEIYRVTCPGGLLILTTPNVLWEPVHALAAITKLHHSEGPHRFLRYRTLINMVEGAGFRVDRTETTVLIPGGPASLVRFGEWIEKRTRKTLMPLVGLRRVIIGQKI